MTKRSTKKASKTVNAETKALYASIQNIAEFFASYVENKPNRDGAQEGTQDTGHMAERRNRFAYVQKQILDGMCWKANAEIERLTTSTLPKAADELVWLERRYGALHYSNNGTENSVDSRIASKQEYIITLEDQLAVLQQWMTICEAAYRGYVGEDWAPKTRTMTGGRDAAQRGMSQRSAEIAERWAGKRQTIHRDDRNSPGIVADVRDIH